MMELIKVTREKGPIRRVLTAKRRLIELRYHHGPKKVRVLRADQALRQLKQQNFPIVHDLTDAEFRIPLANNISRGLKQTYPFPFSDPGERAAVDNVVKGRKFSDVFSPSWFNRYCPPPIAMAGRLNRIMWLKKSAY